MRQRLILVLLAFGLAPAAVMLINLELQRPSFEAMSLQRLGAGARTIGAAIDATMAERFGDAKTFADTSLNRNPANWRKPVADNPLIVRMNSFVSINSFYKIVLLVSPTGEVLAVNSKDGQGKPVRTEQLYQRSFADAPWLKSVMAGGFVKTATGSTGVVFEPPAVSAVVAEAYGREERTLTLAAPVFDAQGKVIGVWANFIDLSFVRASMKAVYGGLRDDGITEGQVLILDADGRVVEGAALNDKVDGPRGRKDWIGFDMVTEGFLAARLAVKEGRSGSLRVSRDPLGADAAIGYARMQGFGEFPGVGWSALVRISSEQAFVVLDGTFMKMLSILGATVVVVLVGGWLVGRSFTAPLLAIEGAMRVLEGGDKTSSIPHADRSDELGVMARSIDAFRKSLLHADEIEAEAKRISEAADAQARRIAQEQADVITTVEAALSAMAKGDLTQQIDQPFAPQYESLRRSINATVQSLADVMVEVSEVARTIDASTGEVAHAADDLSSRTQQQAANLEETAAASEELSSSVKKTAEAARNAEERTTAARRSADASGRIASETAVAMAKIEKSSKEMVSIVDVIEQIAFQTNLLALNAGVEAARAGEAGMGFAVVATEVRALAQRCSEAAKRIKDLIATSDGNVTDGVKLVNASGESLTEIGASIGAIAELVQGIAAACQEQSTGITETSIALGNIDQGTQQNAAMVEETTAAANTLAAQAAQLVALVDRFDIGAAAARNRAAPLRVAASAGPVQVASGARSRPTVPRQAATRASSSPATKLAAVEEWRDF